MIHTTNLRDVRQAVDLFNRAADAMLQSPLRDRNIVRLPARGKLLATGDLHDNLLHLEKILKLAKLRRNREHHVVLHELIHGEQLVNGLDFSHQMLAKVAELVLERPRQVHPILANHELAQMTGREVSKSAGNRVGLFNEAIKFNFGDDWVHVRDAIKHFIGAMPLALMSESGLMCAHSLPSAEVMRRFDLGLLERHLQPFDLVVGGAAYEMVWGRLYNEQNVRQLAEQWGVRLFVLGHQHVSDGIDVRFGNVVVLNSDHAGAAVLPIDLADLPTPGQAMREAISLSSVHVNR